MGPSQPAYCRWSPQEADSEMEVGKQEIFKGLLGENLWEEWKEGRIGWRKEETDAEPAMTDFTGTMREQRRF